MSKGVVLIAVGHAYYGNYAQQLAVSIKCTDPSVPISIITDQVGIAHLNTEKRSIFDKIIDIPEQYLSTNRMPDFLKSKFSLYELSPYSETIFIDADVIWCPKKTISELFDQMGEVKFSMSNRGRVLLTEAHDKFIHWCNPKDLEQFDKAGDSYLYNLASEFIYFVKCKEAKAIFKEAYKGYCNPIENVKSFGTNIPDEYAFIVALLKTGSSPHTSPFIPFYWEHFERKNMQPAQIYQQFYGLSMGGNTNTRNSVTLYNNLANHYNRSVGINGYFPAKDKRSFLPERTTI